MTPAPPPAFSGIPREALAFLDDLGANNARPWFEENKERYKALVVAPLAALVSDLGPRMEAMDPLFDATPAVGRTISRIHRDVRFSKDKSPYRTTAWIVFKRPGRQWLERPAFFFEMSPSQRRHGMGFYSASREAMRTFRRAVLDDPDAFRRIAAALDEAGLRVQGERYVRPPVPGAPEDLDGWLSRKSFYLVRESPVDEEMFSPGLAGSLGKDFEALAPLYRFIARALDADLK